MQQFDERTTSRQAGSSSDRAPPIDGERHGCAPAPGSPLASALFLLRHLAAERGINLDAEIESASKKIQAAGSATSDVLPRMAAVPAWILDRFLDDPVSQQQGVAARNAFFLVLYEAEGTDFFHKPAAIHKLWITEAALRAKAAPRASSKITYGAVEKGIARARKTRDAAKKIRTIAKMSPVVPRCPPQKHVDLSPKAVRRSKV